MTVTKEGSFIERRQLQESVLFPKSIIIQFTSRQAKLNMATEMLNQQNMNEDQFTLYTKTTQIERDTYGPPNRCKKTNSQGWNCYEPVCRNKNGTWSTYCSKHKESTNQYYQKNKQNIIRLTKPSANEMKQQTIDKLWSSEEDEEEKLEEGEIPKCVDCNGETRLKKWGKGYCKRCDACNRKLGMNFSRNTQLQDHFNLKRKYEEATERDGQIFNKMKEMEEKRNKLDERKDEAIKIYEAEIDMIVQQREAMLERMKNKKEQISKEIDALGLTLADSHQLEQDYKESKQRMIETLL